MERAWTFIQRIGGLLLLAEIAIFVIGSTHHHRLLRNSHEFGVAFDQVSQSIVHEISNAAHWVAGKGQ